MMSFIINTTIDPAVMGRLKSMVSALSDTTAKSIIDDVMQDVTTRMRELAIGATPVGERPKRSKADRNPPHMKQQWGAVTSVDGGFAFSNPAPYGYVLEYGLYPNPGRRTVAGTYKGETDNWNAYGVFSKQADSGILGPLTVGGIADDAATTIMDEMLAMFERMGR